MKDLFPQVKSVAHGYAPAEVEEFFDQARGAYEGRQEAMGAADVRAVAFELVRGGYEPSAVDAALDRLEAAFIQRQRADYIGEHGQNAWMDHVASRATTLYPRLVRPAGERFAPPSKGRGYATEDVDALMDALVDYFDSGAPLRASTVRATTFRTARRSKAYDEATVDAFIDRVLDVLLAVE